LRPPVQDASSLMPLMHILANASRDIPEVRCLRSQLRSGGSAVLDTNGVAGCIHPLRSSYGRTCASSISLGFLPPHRHPLWIAAAQVCHHICLVVALDQATEVGKGIRITYLLSISQVPILTSIRLDSEPRSHPNGRSAEM
jgi:hypothetical protein